MFFNLFLSILFFLFFHFVFWLKFFSILIIFIVLNWFFDLYLESKTGFLFIYIKDFLKYGFFLFIFSEFMFFFRIFWYFFDRRITQIIENFDLWRPKNIFLINPFSLPLINTFILLRRGFSFTIFHINIINNKKDVFSIFITIFLALMFLIIQIEEYNNIFFSISERNFRRIFFFSTGFHGLHVFFGLFFIVINFFRFMFFDFFKENILSIEFSIIYWHFVDVIWLFLFIFIYWWNF